MPTTAPDITLLQADPLLPADSLLTPLTDRMAQLGVGVRQLVMQLQMQSDQVHKISVDDPICGGGEADPPEPPEEP